MQPSREPEEIRIGGIAIRFLVERGISGGSVAVFEFDVAPGGKVPGAHSHDAYEETISQSRSRRSARRGSDSRGDATAWPDTSSVTLGRTTFRDGRKLLFPIPITLRKRKKLQQLQ